MSIPLDEAAAATLAEDALARILRALPDGLVEPLAAYAPPIHDGGLLLLRAPSARAAIAGLVVRGTGNVLVIGEAAETPNMVQCAIEGSGNVVFIGAHTHLGGLDIVLRGSGNIVCFGAFATSGGVAVRIVGNDRVVRVGASCMISNRVLLGLDDGFGLFDAATGTRVERGGDVLVDENVWIGRDAVLLNGTEVGAHAVVGQGAIAQGVLRGGCVHGGAPARVLREGIRWSRGKDPSLEAMRASGPYAKAGHALRRLRARISGVPDADTEAPFDGIPWLPEAERLLTEDNPDAACRFIGTGLTAADAMQPEPAPFARLVRRLAEAGAPVAPLLGPCADAPAAAHLLPVLCDAALDQGAAEAVLQALDHAVERGAFAPDALPELRARALVLAPDRDLYAMSGVLRAAIEAGVDDPVMVEAFFLAESQRAGVSAAVDALRAILDQRPAPRPGLRALVVRWEKALALAGGPRPAMAAAEALWRAHAAGSPLDRAITGLLARSGDPRAAQAAILSRPLRQVPLFSAHPRHRRACDELGVDADAQHAAAAALDRPGLAAPATWPCPEGGGAAVHVVSLDFRRVILDGYRGKRPFYLLRSAADGAPAGLILPGADTALGFGPKLSGALDTAQLSATLGQLISTMARDPLAFEQAGSGPDVAATA